MEVVRIFEVRLMVGWGPWASVRWQNFEKLLVYYWSVCYMWCYEGWEYV